MPPSDFFDLDSSQVWSTEIAYKHLQSKGHADSKRTAERRLHALGILPAELQPHMLVDELGRKPINSVLTDQLESARKARKLVLFVQLHTLENGVISLQANDARGARYWIPFPNAIRDLSDKSKLATETLHALRLLQQDLNKDLVLFPTQSLTKICRTLVSEPQLEFCLQSYPKILDLEQQTPHTAQTRKLSTQLKRLEAESIHILREAVAEAENPVMLYSVGKDSSVMLHLARKAFYPSAPPFTLLHVDTRYKFEEMYLFRDYMARESGMELLVHINPEAIARDINPFDHGSSLHTDITKTEGLKQALNKNKYDVIFGGARRDEEKSRAKERIFSFRSQTHLWDPKNQRPELWNLFNTRKELGESIRVFPLSNWTELDIWQYIYEENIPVVPLYFAKERPVVIRNGMITLIDDDRIKIQPSEKIEYKKIRFRTLGCYPLTGAIESSAETLPEIILELIAARSSERQGRAIDSDSSASMEKKKKEGYF
jgi:sulfate adenylyltransferase subunit 2